MVKSGHILQQALFDHLGGDKTLMAVFAPLVKGAEATPYFSFDSLQSRTRDDALGLVAHEIEFSIWSEIQSPKDATELTAKLLARFAQPIAINGVQLIRFEASDMRARVDSSAHAWRTQLTFTALTQSGGS